MRRDVILVAVGLFLLSCNEQPPRRETATTQPVEEAKVPDGPPPEHGPPVKVEASYRPRWTLKDGEEVSAGTAFVIKDKEGMKYLMTAGHLFDPRERNELVAVELHTFDDKTVVAKGEGKPITFGGAAPRDLIVWRLAAGDSTTPLGLAPTNPKEYEWLWILGQEVGMAGPMEAFRAQAWSRGGEDRLEFRFRLHDKVSLRAFSGAPIVNASGQAVGMVLYVDGGETVRALRQLLESKGINPE